MRFAGLLSASRNSLLWMKMFTSCRPLCPSWMTLTCTVAEHLSPFDKELPYLTSYTCEFKDSLQTRAHSPGNPEEHLERIISMKTESSFWQRSVLYWGGALCPVPNFKPGTPHILLISGPSPPFKSFDHTVPCLICWLSP